MSSYLKYMAQTTSVILPEILSIYQIRQKKGWHPWWELNPRPPVRPIGARFGRKFHVCFLPFSLYQDNHGRGDRGRRGEELALASSPRASASFGEMFEA